MKKSRPKNRPLKKRVPRAQQVVAARQRDDELAKRLFAIGRAVEALMELAGRDNVRRASAKLASAQSVAALEAHVANGKLVPTACVTSPATCAVEFRESKDDEVVTPSVIAELSTLPEATKAQFLGSNMGDMFHVGDVMVTVLRAWDVVAPAEAVSP